MSFSSLPFSKKSLAAAMRAVMVFCVLLSTSGLPQMAQATIYEPGETLEPDCAPGSVNCGVQAPATAGANSNINSLSGLSTPLSAGQGGTGISSYTAGDLLYAINSSSLGRLTIGSNGKFLTVSGGALTWASSTNLGANDLTLSGARTVTMGGNTLTFDGAGADVVVDDDGRVRIGGNLHVTGTTALVGNLATPSGGDYVTTGSQDDVNLGTGSLFRYAGVNTATFTGITGGADGRQIRIMNASSFGLTLSNENSGSSAANRILTGSGSDLVIPAGVSVGLQYDATAARWRVVVLPATSATLGSFAFVQGGSTFGATGRVGVTDANAFAFLTSGLERFTVATSSATLIGTGATTLSGGSTLTLASAGGSALNVTASTTGVLTLDSGTTGAVNLGTGNNAKTITIGNVTGATTINLLSGTGGINLTGLVTLGSASTTVISALNRVAVGRTATSTIVGDGGISTLNSDLSVTGSTTLQSLTATNATATGRLYGSSIYGDGQNITLARLGSSTFSTLQDLQNVFHSAGYTSGGAITDVGGGAVSVAAGTGLIRPTNSATDTVYYTDWSASSSVVIPTDSLRYIGVEYNGGTPQITSRTSANWNYKTDFPLGVVANDGGTIRIASDVQGVGDHAANMIWREYETMPLESDMRNGGLMFEESGDGNRNIMLSAGTIWDRLTRYSIDEIDTAMDGSFDTYVSTTLQASAATQWDNQNYNNAGTLTAVDTGKYAVLWFYIITNGELVMVYGTNQYTTVAAATAETEPTMANLPFRLRANGKLIGRLIFQKSATTAADTASPISMSQFSSSALTYLSNLQGLDYENSGLTGFVARQGVTSGQVIVGGKAATDGLTLQSTSGTGSSDFIKFLVGNSGATEAARFTTLGRFGVGTSTPASLFQVLGEATVNSLSVTSSSATSSFAGAVTLASTLGVTGLSTLGSLTVTGNSSLQGLTGTDLLVSNATTTNLTVSNNSKLGTVTAGTWNGTVIGFAYGGTAQTTWTKGDILYASANDTLAKLPIGSNGTVLTAGAGGVPTWAAAGVGGGGGAGQWTTSTDELIIYPNVPSRVVVVGASASTSLGEANSAILDVTGNSVFTGTQYVTGLATLNGGVSSTNLTLSNGVTIGGNATATAAGVFTTNGLITAAGSGTGLSVTNDATIGGLATLGQLSVTGSSTLQGVTIGSATATNVTTTNLYAANFFVDNFSPSNLSTAGTLTVSGQSSLGYVTTTGSLSVGDTLYIAGFATTSNGVVDTQTKYQIAGIDVLSTNTLGSGITNSSLTSVGTLASLIVSGQAVFGFATTTNNLSVGNTLFVNGNTTTTGGVVNTQTKYQIGGVDVLTSSGLGSGILSSSLTSVGTLSSLTVSGQSVLGYVTGTALSLSSALYVGGNATTTANGNFATNGTITSGLINGQTISSAANFTGTLTAASLLTASNGLTLSSGSLTLPSASIEDTALSSNVALLNRTGQTFTSTNTFSALTTFGSASTTYLTASSGLLVLGSYATPKGSDYPTTGSQNDVSLGTGSLFRYTGSNTATFTGIADGSDGRLIRIMNASSFDLTLSHESGSSAAANRITTLSGSDLVITAGVSVSLQYDATAARWRIAALPAAAATVNTFAFIQDGNAFNATAKLGTTDSNAIGLITGGTTRFTVATSSASFIGTGATAIAGGTTLALTSASGSALTVTSGGNGALTLDSATLGAVNVGTGSNAKTITIGNGTGATALNFLSGTGNVNFQVAGTGVTGNVQIGAGGAGSATPDLFVLDVKSTSGDPTGTNGAMYYNSNTGKFRCFENSAWTNCIGTGGGAGSDLQYANAYSTDDLLTNITSATTTLGTVSVTPSTATGDVVVHAGISFRSSNTTDQLFSIAIRQTTCAGTSREQTLYNITSGGGSGIDIHVDLNYVAVDPGASSQTYALCVSASTGDTDVISWSLNALVIDTGADLAEIYTTDDETLEAGDVVSSDPALKTGVRKSADPRDANVIGIVSTRPGMLIGGVDKEGVKAVPIALSGRVPVKVVTENGPIVPGDLLVASSIPGVAMKSHGAGKVVGQAIASYDADGVGLVMVFVKNVAFEGGGVALGDISSVEGDGSDGALVSLLEAIQIEETRGPLSLLLAKISAGEQFLTNFIAARVTAIRGYFEQVDTKKLCMAKADGGQICVDGDQLDALLQKAAIEGVTIAPPAVGDAAGVQVEGLFDGGSDVASPPPSTGDTVPVADEELDSPPTAENDEPVPPSVDEPPDASVDTGTYETEPTVDTPPPADGAGDAPSAEPVAQPSVEPTPAPEPAPEPAPAPAPAPEPAPEPAPAPEPVPAPPPAPAPSE